MSCKFILPLGICISFRVFLPKQLKLKIWSRQLNETDSLKKTQLMPISPAAFYVYFSSVNENVISHRKSSTSSCPIFNPVYNHFKQFPFIAQHSKKITCTCLQNWGFAIQRRTNTVHAPSACEASMLEMFWHNLILVHSVALSGCWCLSGKITGKQLWTISFSQKKLS